MRNMRIKNNKTPIGSAGATVIEVLLVLTIMGLMLRLVTLSLFSSQQRVSITQTRDSVVRSLREQQQKAMMGQVGTGGANVDYSVYIEPTQYTLFPGVIYTNDNPDNTVVPLDPIFRFTDITFPGSMVSFARVSGDVRSYDADQSSVVLTNTQTGDAILITINPRGVVLVQ